jgi:glycosyltransferase involved in cell wall biosynthesis
MKIAVWHNLPSGGSKRALYQQIHGLISRGHQVECWRPGTADNNYLQIDQLCPEHIVDIPWPKSKSVSKYLNWYQENRDLQFSLRVMQDHCRQCAKEIKQRDFDLLLVSTCAAFAVSPIGKYSDLPKVLFLQEPHRKLYEATPDFVWAAPPPGSSWLRIVTNTFRIHSKRIQVREEINNAKHYDRILVNSFFSRENVLRCYGLESEVCYLGIDTDVFRPTGESVENYVVGLGMIAYHKGIDRAIQAIAAIPIIERPNLIWIGNATNDKYLAEMKKLAAELKVNLEIKVLIKDQELVSILNRARLMLYTSRLEPFGLAPLEANACGVPVVAVPEGGIRETIIDGQNGLLSTSASAENMAVPVLRLLRNSEMALTMRKQARELVLSRWKMALAIDRLETVLKQTIVESRN